MNWSRIGDNRWVASDFLERIDAPVYNVYLPIVVKPEEPKPDHLEVTPMSQNDPRWKNDRLGTSSTTIGWNGCLITCVAMIQRYYGIDTDPARLNTWLTANNGYSSGNLFNWTSIPQPISTWELCQDIPAPLNKIDEALARGEPCIVWVDFNPATATVDMHWVLIIGKLADEDYVMIDSWDGWQGSFKARYVNPSRFIFRIVSYKKVA